MNRHKLCGFDWCNFCTHDKWYSGHNLSCRKCAQKDSEQPTHFKEKASVEAYRKFMNGVTE